MSKYGDFSGQHFPVFGPEKTPYLDIFHAVPKIKKTLFANAWLTDPRFSSWVSKSTDFTKANWKLFKKDFSLSNMGIKALVSHANGSNHLKNVKHKEEIQNVFSKTATQKISQSEPEKHPSTESTQPRNPSSSRSASSSTMSTPNPNESAQKPTTKPFLMQQTITNSILDSDSLAAEIVWALKCVMHGYSYNSSCDMNDIVRVMFPDSNISKRYQMGADKIRYLVRWGLAPYFKDKLVIDVNRSKFLSVGFNESLNQVTKTCEMDIAARFWDVNRVKVRYWDSSFMGHTTANDLLQHFTKITDP